MARAKKSKGPALAADGGEPQLVDIEDKQACQVYADWLQEKGDLRGQLMALQLADGDHYSQAQSFALEHRAELLGPVAAEIDGGNVTMTVDFYRGFPRWLRLEVRNDGEQPRGDLGKKLARVPELLGARFLQDVRVQSAIVPRLTPELLRLPGMQKLELDNCTIGGIDDAVWEDGDGHCELRFQYCEIDVDALFERLLVHGSGRVKISVFAMGDEPGYAQDRRFKDVQAIGNDFAGDREARLQLYVLNGGWAADATLPKTAGAAQLRFLTHSKKPIRELALRWLEKTYPQVELPAKGAKLLLLGKPTYHDKDELAAAVKARGWSVAKSADGATHALVMDAPGEALDAALKAKLPVILEARLNATLSAEAPAKAAAKAAPAGDPTEALLSADPKQVLAAIESVRADAIPAELLSPMFSAMCWSTDADVRKAAKATLLAKGGKKAVGYLQGDRTNYAAIVDGAKLWKVTRELCGAVGIDQATFALHLVRMFALRDEAWRADEPLSVAMRFPENEGKLFGWFANAKGMMVLPTLKKSFPKGLGALKAIDTLRVRGSIASDANIAELATLPSLKCLEYGVAGADLRHLASLKDTLRELELSGQQSNCSDLSPLKEWTKLEKLSIAVSPVTDLSPIAGKTTLWFLNLESVPLKSLDVLATLPNLRWLSVAHIDADHAPIAKLTQLESLDVSFSKFSDLRLVAGMSRLQQLNLWGTAVTDLSPIANLPLTNLTITDTKVTDLTPIGSMTKLRNLSMYRVPVSDATLQGIKEALPQCYLSR